MVEVIQVHGGRLVMSGQQINFSLCQTQLNSFSHTYFSRAKESGTGMAIPAPLSKLGKQERKRHPPPSADVCMASHEVVF
jgi:hypothetical protein